jgi:hypothetical protein
MLLPVTFRVSEKDRKDLVEQASAAGLSISEYIRRRTLGHPVLSRSDAALLRELRRQGGLIKHYALSGSLASKEALEAYRAIVKLEEVLSDDRQKNR